MLRVTLLALIAGYADTVGYLHFNAFAGLMTGNTIFMGIELATAKYNEVAFHGSIIFVFLLGVILARLKIRAGAKVWMALCVTSFLLCVCSFVDAFWGALLLALAMGIQNSAANRFAGVTLNHVFITGNLQKLGEEFVAWIWPAAGGQARQGAWIFALAWVGYAGGAGVGALATELVSKPLLIPAAVLPFLMLGNER